LEKKIKESKKKYEEIKSESEVFNIPGLTYEESSVIDG
jgi:hypothetical protein